MSDAPVDRNRLAESASPYLLDHADNPVHWQPWDDTALDAARKQDRPIFLSIGYAACHWCHVMADESFADEVVAERLNEQFIPIKVDREEHPDLDRFYQTAIQVTRGGGGWPLSAWLTPDGRPFQLATYLPKRSQGGRTGFIEVLDQIARQWKSDRGTIETRADEITEAVRSASGPKGTERGSGAEGDLVTQVAQNLLRVVDHERGGFQSNGPKFPQCYRLRLLLVAWSMTGRETYRDAVSQTLDAMSQGGLYDHVAGGFHRYVTDPDWRIPHFEKMLYDNAMLLGLYAEAATRLDTPRYATIARDTATFMQESFRSDTGGYCSSLDAVADGEEGVTYVWTAPEVRSVIDDERAQSIIIDRFGLTERDEVAGGQVLRVQTSLEELASTHDLDHDTVTDRLEAGLQELLTARASRPQPRRDSKVITAWNGLTISGFARAGAYLDEPAYIEEAASILEFVEETLFEPASGQLWRRFRDGNVAIPGFLSDYAGVAVGAFALYWASGSKDAARFGLQLVDSLLTRFWDEDAEDLTFAQQTEQRAPVDALSARDQSVPSPIAQTVEAVSTAHGFRHDGRIDALVNMLQSRYRGTISASGVNHTALARALDRWEHGPPSVTIVGSHIPADWRSRFQRHPHQLTITRRPAGDELDAELGELGLEVVPPLWQDRFQDGSAPTIYACRGRACGPPTTKLEEALAWLA